MDTMDTTDNFYTLFEILWTLYYCVDTMDTLLSDSKSAGQAGVGFVRSACFPYGHPFDSGVLLTENIIAWIQHYFPGG